MRPQRKVTHDGVFYRVPDWDGKTTDESLAHDVRRELDRVDPLPCPHEGEIFERHSLSGRRDFLCNDCGEAFELDPQGEDG